MEGGKDQEWPGKGDESRERGEWFWASQRKGADGCGMGQRGQRNGAGRADDFYHLPQISSP